MFDFDDEAIITLESIETTFTDTECDIAETHARSLEHLETLQNQLEEIASIEDKIFSSKGVSYDDAVTLEHIAPDMLSSQINIKSYTKVPSNTNYCLTLEALNWKKIALATAATIALAGAIYAIYKSMQNTNAKMSRLKKTTQILEKEIKKHERKRDELKKKADKLMAKAPVKNPLSDGRSIDPRFDAVKTEANLRKANSLSPTVGNQFVADMLSTPTGISARMWKEYMDNVLPEQLETNIQQWKDIVPYIAIVRAELVAYRNWLIKFKKEHGRLASPLESRDRLAEMEEEIDVSRRFRFGKAASLTPKMKSFYDKYGELFRDEKAIASKNKVAFSRNLTKYISRKIKAAPLNEEEMAAALVRGNPGVEPDQNLYKVLYDIYDPDLFHPIELTQYNEMIEAHTKESAKLAEDIDKRTDAVTEEMQNPAWFDDAIHDRALDSVDASTVDLRGEGTNLDNRKSRIPDREGELDTPGKLIRQMREDGLFEEIEKYTKYMTMTTRNKFITFKRQADDNINWSITDKSVIEINELISTAVVNIIAIRPTEIAVEYANLIASLEALDESTEINNLIKDIKQAAKTTQKFANKLEIKLQR